MSAFLPLPPSVFNQLSQIGIRGVQPAAGLYQPPGSGLGMRGAELREDLAGSARGWKVRMTWPITSAGARGKDVPLRSTKMWASG